MKPFNRERFLFWMLAGIFIWQAVIFSVGVWSCFMAGGLPACPTLGDRYENTVNVMVATTLALLTGGAVVGATVNRGREGGPSSEEPAAAKPRKPQTSQPPMVSKPEKPDIGVKGLP